MTPTCDVPFLTWGLLRAWKALRALTKRVANLICTFLSSRLTGRVDVLDREDTDPILQDDHATLRGHGRPVPDEASSRVSVVSTGSISDIVDESAHGLPTSLTGPFMSPPSIAELLSSPSISGAQSVHDDAPSRRGECTIVGRTTKTPPCLVMGGPEKPLIEPLPEAEHLPAAQQQPVIHTFNNPHDFVIRNSTFASHIFDHAREDERAAMELLEKKRAAGVEVNSYERYPPPRCHPETRKTTRRSIARWLEDVNRISNMYWLLGSAGVGKSAIAQTIAEKAQKTGRLGGTFFFSRPNGRDDPITVVPTLVHQLAVRFPSYKRIIAGVLAEDRTIFEKGLETQFQLLIIQPFQELQRIKPFTHSILVVVDGLDECRSEEAQASLIQFISRCAKEENVPLAWLVCSRQEWHLQRLLPAQDPTIQCICDELLVNGVEGQDDVYRFICDEFTLIRKRFRDEVDVTWPEEKDVLELAGISSGQFSFASTAMRFIGSDDAGDPDSQLQTCLSVVRKSQISGDINPFHALDRLYLHIFTSISTGALPNAMRIISLHLLLGNRYSKGRVVTVLACANILQLSKATLYSSLRRLHSVIRIPTVENAHAERLGVYHTSLSDFLRDHGRSGRHHDQFNQGHFDSVIQMLKWTSFLNPRCNATNCACNDIQEMSLTWSSSPTESREMMKTIQALCQKIWRGFSELNETFVERAMRELGLFLFSHMGLPKQEEILQFLGWVEDNQDSEHPLLRRERLFPSDSRCPRKVSCAIKIQDVQTVSRRAPIRDELVLKGKLMIGAEGRACVFDIYKWTAGHEEGDMNTESIWCDSWGFMQGLALDDPRVFGLPWDVERYARYALSQSRSMEESQGVQQ